MTTDGGDYYEILGVARSASQEEIKSAYRKAALKFHPDRNPGDRGAEERFKKASEAYSVLGDPEKRARYDRFGTAGQAGGIPWDSEVFDGFGDLLGNLFGFGDLFGGPRGRAARARRGADLRYDVRLTLEEAFAGKEETVEIPREEPCPACGGSGSKSGQRLGCPTCRGRGSVAFQQGFFTVSRTCPQCSGEGEIVRDPCGSCAGRGRVRGSRALKVRIPAGVDSGARLRISGEGERAERGGAGPGDLYLFIEVADHPFFRREREHLLCTIPLSFPQAVLGTEVFVQSLDETEERVKIPPGTVHGQRFRIAGRGMPRVGGHGRGDLYVDVELVTPKRPSKEERRLYEELARIEKDLEQRGGGFFRKVLQKLAEGK